MPVEHHFAPVLPVCRSNLVAQLPLELLHPCPQAPQLVLEPEDMLDTGEVEAELGREPLDEAQAVHVGVGVQARATRGSRGPHETLRSYIRVCGWSPASSAATEIMYAAGRASGSAP